MFDSDRAGHLLNQELFPGVADLPTHDHAANNDSPFLQLSDTAQNGTAFELRRQVHIKAGTDCKRLSFVGFLGFPDRRPQITQVVHNELDGAVHLVANLDRSDPDEALIGGRTLDR